MAWYMMWTGEDLTSWKDKGVLAVRRSKELHKKIPLSTPACAVFFAVTVVVVLLIVIIHDSPTGLENDGILQMVAAMIPVVTIVVVMSFFIRSTRRII